jgi:hypothetical protein
MPPSDRQTATVDKNTDPAKAGRVKVKLPSMDGGQYPEWIETIQPAGMVSHPHPGDTVEVELPDGEDIVEFPDEGKCLGKRADAANPVPSEFKTNYPHRRGYKTPGGHLVIFDDKDKSITIRTIGGHSVLLDDKNGNVKITNSQSGDSIENTSAGTTTVDGTIKIILNSPLTELSTGPLEPVLKATTVIASFTALITAFGSALEVWGNSGKQLADVDVFFQALYKATTGAWSVFGLSLTGWPSAKVTTG